MSRRNRSDRFDRIVGRTQLLAEELAALPEVPTLHRYPITKIQGRGVLVRIDVRRPEGPR